MKVKDVINKLLDCPRDNEVLFVTGFGNKGYDINSIKTSKVTNRTWLSDE